MNEDTDTFEMAEKQQKLCYYSFVRQFLQANQVAYWMGNPSVQITSGTIYFKQYEKLSINEQQLDNFEQYIKQYSISLRNQIINKSKQQNFSSCEFSKYLMMSGISSSKGLIQVCQRLNQYIEWIAQMKVIKINHFKYYAILILMKDQVKSFNFMCQMFGEQYNSLQIQRVLLRQITHYSQTKSNMQYQKQQNFQKLRPQTSPQQYLCQIKPVQQIFIKNHKKTNEDIDFKQNKVKEQLSKQIMSQIKNRQLGSCAICQQQSQNPLISILCSHYFHIKCLSQWKQLNCPLCRYNQHPVAIKFCEECNQCEGLWICLVCGVRLCCGLQNNILNHDSHIYQHYKKIDHKLSINIETKFIFDASLPAFLHELFYKQMNRQKQSSLEQMKVQTNSKKSKLTQKISQYEQSISQEMQNQRENFEQSISNQAKCIKQKIKNFKGIIAQYQKQINTISQQQQKIEKQKDEVQTKISAVQSQLKALATTKSYWQSLLQKQRAQLRNKKQLQLKTISQIQKEISMKKQLLKDFMRNIELSSKIKNSVGKDNIQNLFIIEGSKQNKKKKK